jgi:hypothetical protein
MWTQVVCGGLKYDCIEWHRTSGVYLRPCSSAFRNGPRMCEHILWFWMDRKGILRNMAALAYSRPCSRTGRESFLLSAMLILVRSLHTTCRGSVGFENGNMFMKVFLLVWFSSGECVLGLFSAPEWGLEYAPGECLTRMCHGLKSHGLNVFLMQGSLLCF